jgi:thiamine transport system ATP-binding protein
MLVIENCRLSWPDFVADYSLTVKVGHLCAVIGPSGGGKTTLLHMIAGFETPESGTLTLDGQNLLPLAPAKRPTAIVFQDHNLFPHLNVVQNVGLGLKPSLRLTDDEQRFIEETLDSVGLEGFGNRRLGEMSGGQRQRVALARALVSGRPLILLDEPFSSLDPTLRQDMILLVDEMRRKRPVTILMTIHTPEDAAAVADQMAFVADGRVVASGQPADILNSALAPRIAAAVSNS